MGDWRRAAVAAAMLCGAAGSAAAQEPTAVLGHEIAVRACASCHAVEPGAANDIAPPFFEIANDPERTRAFLIGWLMNPHPPMPDLSLTNAEIAALVAYLDSLKAR
ncbi:MAG: cytochrome c [Proteobacteria bacterium]|nr:cytochrome c [Pseudomonadota bacterium]